MAVDIYQRAEGVAGVDLVKYIAEPVWFVRV
jgi:hypothetical protein